MFWENFYKKCIENNTKPNPLAKKIGISSGIVSKWKTQGTIPNGEYLLKISKELNCSIDYLLDNSESNILTNEEKLLIENYKQLNEEGKEKLISYSDDLVSSGKYIKSSFNEMDKEA